MGLFGGFKAKFTRNSTSKKQPEVVCLRYHVHPEFDRPDTIERPTRNNDIRKPDVIRNGSKKKERKALTKSAIFPESHTSQSSLSSSTPQKSLSLNNLTNDGTGLASRQENGYPESSNPVSVFTKVTVNTSANGKSVAVSDTAFGTSTEEHNGVTTEKVAVVTNSHLYNTENNNIKREEHSRTKFQSRTSYNENGTVNGAAAYLSSTHYESSTKENGQKHLDTDQSTLIFMTQHSSRSSSVDMSTETPNINFNNTVLSLNSNRAQENFYGTGQDDSTKLSFVPNHATLDDDDVDYFKVNVVKHDLNRTYSVSEDEHSVQEEEPRFARMGFSSQAASIFFGDGEESEVVRPRRIQFAEDEDENDERRSSGADC